VTDGSYPRPLRAWLTVAVLLLFSLVSVVDKNIISLLVDTIRQDLQLNDKQLSLLFGPAFAICYALGALPFGWAMDRYSRRLVLWLGVVVWSFGTIFAGLSRGFAQLLAARAIVGAGESVLVPGNQAILAESFPPDRLTFPYAISSTGVMLGQGVSFAVGGLLVALIGPAAVVDLPLLGAIKGWQGILLLVGLPGLLLTPLVFAIPGSARRRAEWDAPARVGYRDYLAYAAKHRRFFVGMHLGSILSVMIYSCLLAWTPAHFLRAHHLPASQVGLWLGAVVVTGPVIGQLTHGVMADRLFRRGMRDVHMRYLAWLVAIAAIPLVAAFTVPNPWLGFALLCVGYGLFSGFGVLGPVALQMMLPSELRGKAASGLTLVTGLAGMALGPTIAAVISEDLFGDPAKIGLSLAIYVAVALPLAGLCYSFAMKPLAAAYAVPSADEPPQMFGETDALPA
jgi:MFS family permease